MKIWEVSPPQHTHTHTHTWERERVGWVDDGHCIEDITLGSRHVLKIDTLPELKVAKMALQRENEKMLANG